MITFNNVTKIYDGEVEALKNISLNIDDGEFVFLTGPSGSGKSTIIKLITKEEFVTSGMIKCNNYDVVNMKTRNIPKYRRCIGVIYQDFRLIETKTVWDNIDCVLTGLGRSGKECRKYISETLDRVGIYNKRNNYPKQLSGGEQQRVAIARALSINPKIVIADEPTGNLDFKTSEGIMNILYDINKHGTTILTVTHEIGLINESGKRIIKLDDGIIISDEKAVKPNIYLPETVNSTNENINNGIYLGESEMEEVSVCE